MPNKVNYTELSDAELKSALDAAKDELFTIRFRHAASQLENTALLSQTKKTIARVETEIRRREIAAAEAALVGAGSEGSN